MGDTNKRIIDALKNTNQTLVFLESKICPIRSIVGQSKGDEKMKAVLDKLVSEGIVEYYTGFMSLSEKTPFLYATSLVLNDKFFEDCCRVGEQLLLFESTC
ncbi:MAG: hypothetical protein AAGA43_13460 [Bacteroidota bacterium]